MVSAVLSILLVIISVCLVGLILLQRGRGGGLAGAFGMGGGESAFGARAATMAQKATMVLGALLLILTLVTAIVRGREHGAAQPGHVPASHLPADQDLPSF